MTESKPTQPSNRIRFAVKNENGQSQLTSSYDGNPSQLATSMATLSGGKDIEFATLLLTNVAQVISPEHTDWAFNQAASLMNGLAPQDEQEGILITQMAAVYMAGMYALARASERSQTASGADLCINRATKLLNLYARQQELLERKRHGNQTIQKVVVERVEVQAGGQAVVGAISQPGGGGRKRME